MEYFCSKIAIFQGSIILVVPSEHFSMFQYPYFQTWILFWRLQRSEFLQAGTAPACLSRGIFHEENSTPILREFWKLQDLETTPNQRERHGDSQNATRTNILNQWIGLRENLQEAPYLMGKSMVSCRFSLNQSID